MNDPGCCPRCGARLDRTGPCAACLLEAATAPPEAPDLAGVQLGPYAIGRMLGQGGMGVVYEAVDTRRTSCPFGHVVALKILAADLDASAQIVREAQLAAALEHEHIVPVYEAGEHEGIAYLAMKCIDGGPLAAPAPDARRAAEIAMKIARAVEFAHRHGVLHRDLKPANVLIDAAGRPFVTDFGLAAREELAAAAPLVPGGTPAYMAPEVLRGDPGAATTAADVWGVGAILYELLAGRPPFEASSWDDLRRRVTAEPPPALAGVPPDLAAVCLRCLEKEPARRYATAGDLADDLARFLAGEPVRARPLGLVARWLRRAARHPLMVALTALLLATALHAAATMLSLARAQEAALRAADFAARRAADLTALQFERYKAAVEAAARDPRSARALADPSSVSALEVCASFFSDPRAPAGPFTSWNLFDIDGRQIGRAPLGTYPTLGSSYVFRDYFRGVQELERRGVRAAYVSRAFRSEGDGEHVIAIASAIHDDADRWVGLLIATVPTGSALGSIVLDDPGDDGLTAALLAPRDRERSPGAGDPDAIFLLHHALGRGEQLPARTDEVLGADGGSGALVRLVPVRGTPFSVVVRVAFDGRLARP